MPLTALAAGVLLGVGAETAGPGTVPRAAVSPPGQAAGPSGGDVLLAPVDTSQRQSPAAQRSTGRTAVAAPVPQQVLARTATAAGDLAETARVSASSLRTGVETAGESRAQLADIVAARQLHRPILEGTRTSSYGWRWGRMHEGMDIAADHGTPLYAVGQGRVTTAEFSGGLGLHVKLTLDDGTVLVYGHLSTLAVKVGDEVAAGEVLGEVGSTGRSTGAHLHFEVRVADEPLDPGPWLTERFGTEGW
ncbi:M23 family metallopeptidase [Ornithinicoccus hortensis]|uniref:Peptidase M23-like protein n=1 Tax=Ornithinicoccus hortensis TaxID=82346 RepID=A0A542YQ96_9MICO|nr:peptidase M23-like protein [Ornithinicoccus hortensis]